MGIKPSNASQHDDVDDNMACHTGSRGSTRRCFCGREVGEIHESHSVSLSLREHFGDMMAQTFGKCGARAPPLARGPPPRRFLFPSPTLPRPLPDCMPLQLPLGRRLPQPPPSSVSHSRLATVAARGHGEPVGKTRSSERGQRLAPA
jgi:hypothetical protein